MVRVEADCQYEAVSDELVLGNRYNAASSVVRQKLRAEIRSQYIAGCLADVVDVYRLLRLPT